VIVNKGSYSIQISTTYLETGERRQYYCYYLYSIDKSHFVPCLLSWQVLYPLWWISGML